MTTTYMKRLRMLSRDVRLVLISYTTAGFCYFGIISVLLNLYLLRLDYGPEFIGLFNGVSWLAMTVFCLPAGAIGVRWGSRRTMILGVGLIVVGYALLPLGELMPGRVQAGWLLVTNSLAYVGGALWSVNGITFLADSTSPEERGHAFSMQAALMPLAGFAGNLVGGFLPGLTANVLGVPLDGPASYRYPLWVAAAGYGLVGLPALLATRRPARDGPRDTAPQTRGAPYGRIARLVTTRLLWAAGGWAASVFFNVYMDAGLKASTSLIGTLGAIGSLMSVPAGLATAVLLKRLRKGHTVFWGALGLVLGLLALAFLPHWVPAGLGLAAVSVANTIASAAYNVYSQEIVQPRWRAAMSGASMMAWALSSSIVSFGGGYIIAEAGYRSLFLGGVGAALVGALLFWGLFLRRSRRGFAGASGDAGDGE